MAYTSKTYALINKKDKRHLQEVLKYLVPRREEKILEIGCGRGFVVRELQNVSPETYGIDVNPNSIKHGVSSAWNLTTQALTSYIRFTSSSTFRTLEKPWKKWNGCCVREAGCSWCILQNRFADSSPFRRPWFFLRIRSEPAKSTFAS